MERFATLRDKRPGRLGDLPGFLLALLILVAVLGGLGAGLWWFFSQSQDKPPTAERCEEVGLVLVNGQCEQPPTIAEIHHDPLLEACAHLEDLDPRCAGYPTRLPLSFPAPASPLLSPTTGHR